MLKSSTRRPSMNYDVGIAGRCRFSTTFVLGFHGLLLTWGVTPCLYRIRHHGYIECIWSLPIMGVWYVHYTVMLGVRRMRPRKSAPSATDKLDNDFATLSKNIRTCGSFRNWVSGNVKFNEAPLPSTTQFVFFLYTLVLFCFWNVTIFQ